MSDRAPVHGVVDAQGALVEADPPLQALQQQAGGVLGATLAIPPLASLARITRRLRTPVSRAMVVADGETDLDLFVRATPRADQVLLTVASWRTIPQRPPLPAAGSIRRRDHGRAAADWTWESDAALKLIALSPQAEWSLGEPLGALLGQPLSTLFRLLPDGDGRVPLLEALADQVRFDDQRAERRTPEALVFRIAGTPLLDEEGHFGGFRGSAVRLASETVPIVTPAIGEDQLSRALRRPLDAIIAQAETLAAADDGPLRADYAGYAEDIAAAARHLIALVEDIADLDAIERPDFAAASEPIDLADVGRHAAGLLSVRAGRRSIGIKRPAAEVGVPATGEYRRVLQIVVNLVGNAVRHAPTGSKIRVRAESNGEVASISVADRGPGIDPVDQPRIFEKFVRLDPAAGEGSGLGLYISRRLARAMGGDLVVESRPGGGAVFTLKLPAGPPPSA